MCDNCCVSTNTRKRTEGKMTPWRFESGGFGRKIVRLFFSFFFSLWLAIHPNISEDANRQTDKKGKRYADVLVDPKKKKKVLSASPFFSFNCLPLLCAVIKGAGTKQQSVGSFLAVSYIPCSLFFTNYAWILDTSDALSISTVHNPLFACLEMSSCCGETCGFDVSFSLRWKNWHIQFISMLIYTYILISLCAHTLQLCVASK